jgi:hypothetical protein
MLYFVAIWEYSKPLLLEFYIYIAVLASDLRTVSIYSGTKFLLTIVLPLSFYYF